MFVISILYEKLYSKGEKNYEQQQYKQALMLFMNAYASEATNDCENYIGCCYIHLEQYNDAERIFEKLINIAPEWERPVFNLGNVYLKQNMYEDALNLFKKAKEINPFNADVYYYLGVYYRTIKEYEKAIQHYNKAISLNDKEPEPYLDLGICYFKLRDIDKALYCSQKAYDLNNNDLTPLFNKAMVFIFIKKYGEALEILENLKSQGYYDEKIQEDIDYCKTQSDGTISTTFYK